MPQSIFCPDDNELKGEHYERRMWIAQQLGELINKFDWNKGITDSRVCFTTVLSSFVSNTVQMAIVLTIHGTTEEKAGNIVRTGFAALKRTDEGYYGEGRAARSDRLHFSCCLGIYSTSSVDYAVYYAKNSKDSKTPDDGTYFLILSYVLPGNSYPCCERPKKNSPDSMMGKQLKFGYNSHYVLVNPGPSEFGLPCAKDAEDFVDELGE